MALITAALVAMTTPTTAVSEPPDYYDGSLSRYAPGVMEGVMEWRHGHGIPGGFDPYRPEYAGFVAVVDCRNVGRAGWLWLTVEGERRPLPYRVYVADCASPGSAAADWMERERIAGEVDYAAWTDWGIVDGQGAWVEIVLDG